MSSTGESPVSISLVVPVYAGREYLDRLVEEAAALRDAHAGDPAAPQIAELIFVDDCARDGSSEVIDRLAREHPWIVALHLARNYGQHAATIAGILHSSGDWVVTLDEDLQHPPAAIPDLLRHAAETGADVVYANAEAGVHDALARDLTSRSFKRMMEWLTGNADLRHFNSFRLIRGPIARAAASVCAHDTYFDINLSWFTQRVGARRMALKDERYISTGQSGYTFKSLLGHAARMLFSSQIRVLRFGAVLGFGVMTLSVLLILYFLAMKLIWPESVQVQGWTSLILAISFFGGLLACMLGIALQYLSTLVLKAHGKPTFFTIDRSNDAALTAWFNRTDGPGRDE